MVGQVVWERGPGRTRLEIGRVGGLDLAVATLRPAPGLWGGVRLRAGVRRARRFFLERGVRRLILPPGGEGAQWFPGFGRVDPMPFYRAVADVLVLGVLRGMGAAPGRERVLLSGPRLCPELEGAARRLCPLVRGVAIDVPGEGASFAAWLHRRYGLPVCRPEGARVTAAFGSGGQESGVVLSLYEGGDLGGAWVTAPELALSPGCEGPLLAALWEQGSLDRERLQAGWTPLDKRD